MGLDIFLYSQHRQNVAIPAPYHPVCELSRDFSLITGWISTSVRWKTRPVWNCHSSIFSN